ncbi:hypothetical protein [Nocardiopsis sp. CNT312]|uniref:hypothetical protein n=1 Tax=Nocardiopsis sp. CNT312 TaxID=1137268 RepID=UPI00048F05A4|nr:hypothetical protein [Nocardiopsis sp. CNT312]
MAEGTVARSTARMLERRGVTRAGASRVSVLVAVAAAVWFSRGDAVGAVVGALFLAAVLFCDAVRSRMRADRRDALTMWLAAMLAQLREYVVYAGLAFGAVAAGIEGAWAWAAGALIALALRDSFLVSRSAPPAAAPAPGFNEAATGAQRPSGGLLKDLLPAPPQGPKESDPAITGRLFGTGGGSGTAPRSGPAPEPPARKPRPAVPGSAPPAVLRRLLAFTQSTRFLVIAVTATFWDARAALLTLTVGCALAVTCELIDPTTGDAG